MIGKLILLIAVFTGPTAMSQEPKLVDPNSIGFTIPTINDEIPVTPLESVVRDRGNVSLHEDNWRQFEFISESHMSEIEREIAAIDDVWENHSTPGEGFHYFNKLHVRKLIPKPLSISMSLEAFEEISGARPSYLSLSFSNKPLLDVWAADYDGFKLYAQFDGSTMITLGMDFGDNPELYEDVVENLIKLASENQLVLVDWLNGSMHRDVSKVFGAPGRE